MHINDRAKTTHNSNRNQHYKSNYHKTLPLYNLATINYFKCKSYEWRMGISSFNQYKLLYKVCKRFHTVWNNILRAVSNALFSSFIKELVATFANRIFTSVVTFRHIFSQKAAINSETKEQTLTNANYV